MGGAVQEARDAFRRQAWGEAYERFSDALGDSPETPEAGSFTADDLECLAVAAYLVGRDEASATAWERAHDAARTSADHDRAVRCAVWVGLVLTLRGDMARAGGWLARAQRLVDEEDPDGPGRGYLLVPAALHALGSGDADGAAALGGRAEAIARQFGDADLLAFSILGQGQAAIAAGDIPRGTAFLDEVMIAVTGATMSPITTGIVYCAVVAECVALFDVRRAAEWTASLSRWCDDQPDLVPFRGQCLVHRSQVLQLHGEWPEAAAEAARAQERLAEPPHPALGLACYQRGELHRLRGEIADAESAYREASRHGYEPVPGLALLRLADGRADLAVGTIRRALDETQAPLPRARILGAAVEIMLAAGAPDDARALANEMAALVHADDAPLLHAMTGHAAGSAIAAAGDPAAALPLLRGAAGLWAELQMPYEGARTRVQIGAALRALGDGDTADLEFEAARAVFEDLDARVDLDRLAAVTEPTVGPPGGLTERECEVLRLVAAGRTNRQIGEELVISEHTVARHVQNIFTKLGLSSRAAATAYAYEHDLT